MLVLPPLLFNVPLYVNDLASFCTVIESAILLLSMLLIPLLSVAKRIFILVNVPPLYTSPTALNCKV